MKKLKFFIFIILGGFILGTILETLIVGGFFIAIALLFLYLVLMKGSY